MKIAFILHQFPALSETFILNQITGLLDRGHDVYIFANSAKDAPKKFPEIKKYRLSDKVSYYNMPLNPILRILKACFLILKYFPQKPKLVLQSLNFLKYKKKALSLKLLYTNIQFIDKDFDIIHCHFGPLGINGIALKELMFPKAKVLVSFRGYDMSEKVFEEYKREYPLIFQKADLFLPVCNLFKKILIEKGCEEDKIVVHHSGTDVSLFKCKENKKSNKEQINILTVGRLTPKKGIEYSIKAIAKTREKSSADIRYTIVGDGPERDSLEKLVSELGIEDKVKLLGSKTHREIVGFMQDADIFLSSNLNDTKDGYDGIPGVIREAKACCLPVLSTKAGGIPEIVLDGETGFLVNEKDVDALVVKLNYLIKNPEKRIKMGKKGRENIEKFYDIEKLNDSLVGIYKGECDF